MNKQEQDVQICIIYNKKIIHLFIKTCKALSKCFFFFTLVHWCHVCSWLFEQERLAKEKKLSKDLGQAATKLQQLLKATREQLTKERETVRTLQEHLENKVSKCTPSVYAHNLLFLHIFMLPFLIFLFKGEYVELKEGTSV